MSLSHTDGGGLGAQSFHPLIGGGGEKFYPVLRERGAQTVLDLRFSHFVAPPLPIINERSLKEKEVRMWDNQEYELTIPGFTTHWK